VVVRVRVENIAKGNRGARGKQIVALKENDAVVMLASLVGKVEGGAAESSSGEAPPSKAPRSEELPKARGNGYAVASDGHERKVRAETKPVPRAHRSDESSRRVATAPQAREEKAAADSTPARSGKSAGDGERLSEKQVEIELPAANQFASFKPLPKKK